MTPQEEIAELRSQVRALTERLHALAAAAAGHSPRFAAVYPAFEDRFRGTEDDVRERLAGYLPGMVEVLRRRGLEVVQADALAHLDGVAPQASAAAARALEKGFFGPQDYAVVAVTAG